MADDNVWTLEMADDNVWNLEMAVDNVWTLEMADDNVRTLQMADDNIWTLELADDKVWTLELVDDSVNNNRRKMAIGFRLNVQISNQYLGFIRCTLKSSLRYSTHLIFWAWYALGQLYFSFRENLGK